jgi:hypothetical protein
MASGSGYLDSFAVRIVKPLLVSAMMFGSVYALCGMPFIALLCAMLPLLLGWLDIMTGAIYVMTGIVLIAAVIWTVLPREEKAIFHSVSGEIIHNVSTGMSPSSVP